MRCLNLSNLHICMSLINGSPVWVDKYLIPDMKRVNLFANAIIKCHSNRADQITVTGNSINHVLYE